MSTEDTAARIEQIRESFTEADIDWLIGEVYRLTAELVRARSEARDAGERLDSYRYVDSRIVRRVHEAHHKMHQDGKLDHTFNVIGDGCPMCVAERQGYDDQERYDLRLIEVTADRDRLAGLLDHATRFVFSDLSEDHPERDAWAIVAEYRGGGQWTVEHVGTCLDTVGDRDTALCLAEQHSHTITANGMTAADVLAKQAARNGDQ